MNSTYILHSLQVNRLKHQRGEEVRSHRVNPALFTSVQFDKLVSKPPSILKNVHPRRNSIVFT